MTLDELQTLMREHSLKIECIGYDLFIVDSWPEKGAVKSGTLRGAIDAFLEAEREDASSQLVAAPALSDD